MVECLNDLTVERFMKEGYLLLEQYLSGDEAEKWAHSALTRLGCDHLRPETWMFDRVFLQNTGRYAMNDCAPRLWDVICQLLGGEERVEQSFMWDSFIVNLQPKPDQFWSPPSANVKGWHIDGDSFRHFLDSPEQAMVALFHWTDALPKGGCTYVASDSLPIVSSYLLQHPEGVMPRDLPYGDLIRECHDFREITASAGDILLLHPFTLHSASVNSVMIPRIITNSNIRLREPKNLNRVNGDYSAMERAILQALGVDSCKFTASGSREQFTSPRALASQEHGVTS